MNTPAHNIRLECSPASSVNQLQYSILKIRVKAKHLSPSFNKNSRIVIRTNLNQADNIRQQIIDLAERGQSYSTDYYDIVAEKTGETDYSVDILLNKVGYYEFKARIESTDKSNPWVHWAEGSNIGVSVTPLPYGRDNSIYCAFIRQFGLNKDQASLVNPELEKTIEELENQGAHVLPPGGNFKNFIEELPFIIQKLGMKIIHLLPINPVPTSYGRMGMYGSPYATTDFFGIDHTYADFSRYKTIEDQFIDLTSTIHGLGARVFLDMVVNHTGWASSIHFTHRHWRVVDENRKIVSPGAWGVVWGDLVELDYQHRDLWQYMAEVFLTWCRRGIDGFRLDAGYMVPIQVWKYIISRVRQEFPNTLFLLEGLGGPWETTETLLTHGQMNWAYSELFQNYSREEIINYLGYAQHVSAGKGVLVHYAETHDNDRLAKKGKTYTVMRLYISALTSFSGAWGFTNGVEWLANEKINVHRNTGLNWGSKNNLVNEIANLNKILAENPAFWQTGNLNVLDLDNDELFAFTRSTENPCDTVLCIINLNTEKSQSFGIDYKKLQLSDLIDCHQPMVDLLSDKLISPLENPYLNGSCAPGGCKLYLMNQAKENKKTTPAIFDVDYDKIGLIYHILLSRFRPEEIGKIDQECLLRSVKDFRKFIALVNTHRLADLIKMDWTKEQSNVDQNLVDKYSSLWTFRDSSREFIIPGNKWLVIHTFVPCTAYLKMGNKKISMESIPSEDGMGHLTFFKPRLDNVRAMLTFNWKLQRENMIQRQWQQEDYPILSIPTGQIAKRHRSVYPLSIEKNQLHDTHSKVFLTNGLGGLSQVPATPAEIDSKYDTLFSITPDLKQPADRISLVKMVKETIQVDQKYFDLDESFFTKFTRYPHPMWEFVYDDDQYHIRIQRSLIMVHGQHTMDIRYKILESNAPLTLTSKFYLEHRNLHFGLKADEKLNEAYNKALKINHQPSEIHFQPDPDIELTISAKRGEFISQPQWVYGLKLTEDRQRGLEEQSDLYAPGVFSFELTKGDSQIITLTTEAHHVDQFSLQKTEQDENKRMKELMTHMPQSQCLNDPVARMLLYALDQFIVKSDDGWVMLSGYPWLGQNTNDSLRCVEALLLAGRDDVARSILIKSAQSEKKGRLADWILGGPESYELTETSLRFIMAVSRYIAIKQDQSFWDVKVNNKKTFRDVARNIYEKISFQKTQGTRLHDASGLIFNPNGQSWMNTQQPQTTPRSGYPVELQGLWYQVLEIVQHVLPEYQHEIQEQKQRLKKNFTSHFWHQERNHLADILLCPEGYRLPKDSLFDSALRFNQLTAVHAGLVDSDKTMQILKQIQRKLLVPCGLRSLSEDILEIPLEVMLNGRLLIDPSMPYQAKCVGNETDRRLAYHNGTAWVWAYASYIEAGANLLNYSDSVCKQGLAFFEPIWNQLRRGGIGTLSEMLDGNFPHTPRGCFAYSLSVAEVFRVYMHLKYTSSYPESHHLTASQIPATVEII